MGANYVYIPQSVEGVSGLESMLTISDPNRNVRFRGVRVIESGLLANDGTSFLLPEHLEKNTIVIFLQSELSVEDLDDLIDDHTRSAQQGYLIPISKLQMVEANGSVQPAGTSELLLPGSIEEGKAYFALSANMDVARRYCRLNLLPEIIYDPDEALEGFLRLRRELEVYLGYGVRRVGAFQDSYLNLDHDRLMKALRMVEIVTDEKFPKFRDSLFDPEFRNEFIETFLDDMARDDVSHLQEIDEHRRNDLFILFTLIKDLVGTEDLLHSLSDRIPGDLRDFLWRIVRRS